MIPYAWKRFELWGAGIHMQSVTQSLKEWELEYGRVHNKEEAKRGIEMLEYIQHYYRPGPGYRSDAETESNLESQREKTMNSIVSALRDFSGKNLGEDVKP